MAVVPFHVRPSGQSFMPEHAVEFDQQTKRKIPNVGPGCLADTDLAGPGGETMCPFDVLQIQAFERAFHSFGNVAQ